MYSSSSSFKPQQQHQQQQPTQQQQQQQQNHHQLIRQDGFHPVLTHQHQNDVQDMTYLQQKYDFTEDLATLIAPSNERSTGNDYHRQTHNIFDTSGYHQFDPHFPQPNSPPARSRSRSRPPASPSIGPTRTTRTRRNNSVSSTSPPPRPQAIVIPGARGSLASSWYMPTHSATSEYSLPTPDSLHSHSHPIHSHHQQHPQYSTFGLSPPDSHPSASPPQLSGPPPPSSTVPNALPPLHSMHNSTPTPNAASSPNSKGDVLLGMSGMGSMMGGMGMMGLPALPSSAPTTNGMHHHHHQQQHHGGGHHHSASVGSATAASAAGAVVGGDKQALLANEKRRRRRESHNAVERRRRDNINEKISELATLIPECMLDGGAGLNGAVPTSPLSPCDDTLLPSPLESWSQAAPLVKSSTGETKKEDTPSSTHSSHSPRTANATTPGTATMPTNGVSVNGAQQDGETSIVKANKGMILRKSVEYIRYLQQLVAAQGARNRALEMELRGLRGTSSGSGSVNGEVGGVTVKGEPGHDIGGSDDGDTQDVSGQSRKTKRRSGRTGQRRNGVDSDQPLNDDDAGLHSDEDVDGRGDLDLEDDQGRHSRNHGMDGVEGDNFSSHGMFGESSANADLDGNGQRGRSGATKHQQEMTSSSPSASGINTMNGITMSSMNGMGGLNPMSISSMAMMGIGMMELKEEEGESFAGNDRHHGHQHPHQHHLHRGLGIRDEDEDDGEMEMEMEQERMQT